ncbi:hypothetical protein [Amycolatopsis thailandensis]|uniref:hypothetical protein n=1 Tax=Amycolatopsis thailandensis TaxID=589330 RepID=UPI0036260457
MPVTFSERPFDPEDPMGSFRDRSMAEAAVDVEDSLWVEPDYSMIPGDADVPSDDDERYEVWPGPAMVMPNGLLPDGTAPTRDIIENAYRIQRVRYADQDDADVIIGEYWRQQGRLRDCLGLPRARRDATGKPRDTPETLQRIVELHEAERRRRHSAF